MDTVDTATRSRIMSCIRSESGIEILPKRFMGLYLRRHPKGVVGKPDFGNKTRKVAVFIDGCFWHGCPKCYREPKSNTGFWREKVERNKRRDAFVGDKLKGMGWIVIRVWECDLK